jgi:SSS family solute:Na+ symporter
VLAVGIIAISLMDSHSKDNPKGITVDAALLRTSPTFNIGATLIAGAIAALYIIFW